MIINKETTTAIDFFQLITNSEISENNNISQPIEFIQNTFFEVIVGHEKLDERNKKLILELAKKDTNTDHCIKQSIRNEIISEKHKSFIQKSNEITRLTFLIIKFFRINSIKDIDKNLFNKIKNSFLDEKSIWRTEIPPLFRNALIKLVKTINAESPIQLELKAYTKESEEKGRAPRETKLEYLCKKNPNYQEWSNLWNEWKKSFVLKNAKALSSMLAHFFEYLEENNLNIPPFEFLLREKKPCYWSYIKAKNKDPRPYALKIQDFTTWIIKDKLSDKDDGEYISLATPLLTTEVHALILSFNKSKGSARSGNEIVKSILPIKYLSLLKKILTENNFEWPKSIGWSRGALKNHQTGEIEEDVWCPHFALMFLFLLEVPLRRIQVMALDSGEGDLMKWEDGNWVDNTSCHSGYWSKNFGDKLGRGVLRQGNSAVDRKVAIYVNTNKTQDIGKGFGATSGYVINWHNDEVIEIVKKMRQWNEAYNPVDKPIPYRDIPPNIFSDSPTEGALSLIPDRFYLFRYPLNTGVNGKQAPPADWLHFKFWHSLMNELENRLKSLGEDTKITLAWHGSTPQKSIFTPHSLRGSGLTALAEAGVPIEVLSKVVAGHSSILMTLAYVKFSNAHISKVLDEARVKIEASEQENYTTYLKNSTWSDAYKYTIFNDENTAEGQWHSTLNCTLFENRQIGICPNSGTKCHEGGEVLRRDATGKSVFSPVPGGNGNCVRCRFFMTGMPFLIPLWLKTNKDLADARVLSEEVAKISENLELSRKKRYEIAKTSGPSHIPASLQAEIKQHEAMLDAKSAKLNETLTDAHATYTLVEKLRGLASNTDSSLPVPIDLEECYTDKQVEFQEVSNFAQRDFLVQASRLYPHIKDDLFELQRNNFIDRIIFSTGGSPITLSDLSDEEKSIACDAASNFLKTKINDFEFSMLESGRTTVEDLSLNPKDYLELTKTIRIQKHEKNLLERK